MLDTYNSSLVKTTPESLSAGRNSLAATSIGNYALFGGGTDAEWNASDVVDAYNVGQVLVSKMILELPIGTKYKFTEHTEEQSADQPSILVNSPATGYIKYKSGIIENEPS